MFFKKNFFQLFGVLTSVILTFLLFIIADFSLSNTIYKKKNCINFKDFEKGFYYDLKPNCKSKYRFKSGFPTVDLITDENGLRSDLINKKIDPNKENIFIFGDSFTFGVGLEYDETYVGHLNKKLKDFNVLNFAVGSYSPTVYLFRLKEILKKNIIPKKIIVFLDLTDVIDESQRWYFNDTYGYPLRPERRKKNDQDFLKDNFKLTFELITLIRLNLRKFKKNFKNINDSDFVKISIQGQFTYTEKEKLDNRFWKEGYFDKGLLNIKKDIHSISEITQRENSEFYLVIYPWAETLHYGQNSFNWEKYAENLCKDFNCKLINSIPHFEKYKHNHKKWPTDLFFIGDEHFNKNGAKLLSEVLIKNIN